MLYFTLAAEAMGREAGAGGVFVMPVVGEYAYKALAAVAGPVGTADWMEAHLDPWEGKKQSGKAYLGSSPLKRKQLQQLRELAQQQYETDIHMLRKGDTLLERMRANNKRAAFQASTRTIFLQPQATYFEVRHELYHAQQCAELGVEAYAKQSRLDKEMYVYKKLMEEKHNLTPPEVEAAVVYINDLRGDVGQTPL